MGNLGRKKRGHNRGYFFRSRRGWYANDGKRMVPLLFADGPRIQDKETPDGEVEAAYERWKRARQTADKARAGVTTHGEVTVEDVCRVYLAEAGVNGARETFLGRADSRPGDFGSETCHLAFGSAGRVGSWRQTRPIASPLLCMDAP